MLKSRKHPAEWLESSAPKKSFCFLCFSLPYLQAQRVSSSVGDLLTMCCGDFFIYKENEEQEMKPFKALECSTRSHWWSFVC